MKHLIKTSLWLLAFMTAGGMLVSCVEEEQEPDFSEAGGSTSAKIDVKMPAPGSQVLYVGSEVLLKGSDFSGRDEVYVQRATYHYNEDTDEEEYVTDGPKVRAEVTGYTSAELTFLVPDEVVQGQGTALVFFKRGGKEYRLGRMEIQPFPVSLEMYGQLMGGGLAYLRSYNPEFAFGNDDKVFLQNCVEQNGIWVGVGEKIQAEVQSINSSELYFIVPQQIKGEVLIILEHNGGEAALDGYFAVESFLSYVSLDSQHVMVNQEVNMIFRGDDNLFTDTDEVYLRPVRGGEKVEAAITYRDGRRLSFIVPDLFNGASGEAVVILKHYGVENELQEILQIYGNY